MNNAQASVAITLKHVQKTFADGTVALKPQNLHIEKGEILVLLGPSGCGKTTTLRLIAGLEFCDPGGQILFGDRDVTNIAIEQRRVGMVFQSYALFPNMNVSENIGYGLRVRGESKALRAQKIEEMLALFDLQPYAHRHIDQLSGGQRQRVALARAIVTEPEVLLLDEPLSALDAFLKKRLRTDINALLKRLGITAVYVTHDQEEAMAMGDRIAVLDHGEIVQIGSAQDIYHAPNSAFVANFIGHMNHFSGRLNGRHLHFDQQSMPLPESLWPAVREGVLSDGAPVQCMARPEDIRIIDGAEATLQGRVTQSVFLGDRTRLLVEVAGVADCIYVDCFERRVYQQGETVGLAIPPSRLVMLPMLSDRSASC
ncbi:ABC transporter ATP-binding protein [Gynuella sunshinyii]|uniref:ABC-type spermidine/putrescine transport system, ATPase component n=1 Tax=Gynuella sunshinyii YC6258 TaxID=1445510 RepID=A0A0C5VWK6_9GAMM|nr:ABC transporter ATP-binding protein [Gynuella sunshinyii]AJQ94799.1 ABC-type spermidine/putrescine transport system, ATPase component [Gynuella sunshinyii YC6258]